MEGSGLGLRRPLRRVLAFQKNAPYAWYLVYEYRGTAGHQVRLLYFKAPPFCGQLLVLRAAPGLMGGAQGRSPPPHSFSEDCSNVRREVFDVRSPTTPSSPQELAQNKNLLRTWYLIHANQVLLLCTCCVFEGATFGGQLLVRGLSQRWVWIVSRLH